MPHRDSAVADSSQASERAASLDRGILNTVATEDDADVDGKALHFYQQLSDKQKKVVQAKQRTQELLAKITHSDSKAEQVERMDEQVMSGSVFGQAARLQVAEGGYDGAEEAGEEEEESTAETVKEADDEVEKNTTALESEQQAGEGRDENSSKASSLDEDTSEPSTVERNELGEKAAHTQQES